MGFLSLLVAGGLELDDLKRSLPTQTILCFYDYYCFVVLIEHNTADASFLDLLEIWNLKHLTQNQE